MADLHKYQRSKEKLIEILRIFDKSSTGDKKLNSIIANIKKAINVIDNKIEKVSHY